MHQASSLITKEDEKSLMKKYNWRLVYTMQSYPNRRKRKEEEEEEEKEEEEEEEEEQEEEEEEEEEELLTCLKNHSDYTPGFIRKVVQKDIWSN
ncbi:hypothetical protein MDA_GLEAN10014298 [Myotis davidii]|uniref:Uncharacterized protein n=1 Tax=Myotis davidii TaxID=225400 RepID=L5MJP1_MYODS|nr:hypothetical protein MDA_GLEAN10014298 [Myotis davidii]